MKTVLHEVFNSWVIYFEIHFLVFYFLHLHKLETPTYNILPGRIVSIYSLGVVISDVVLLSFTSFTCKVRKMQWFFLETWCIILNFWVGSYCPPGISLSHFAGFISSKSWWIYLGVWDICFAWSDRNWKLWQVWAKTWSVWWMFIQTLVLHNE